MEKYKRSEDHEAMTTPLPAGPICEMLPADQDRAGQIIIDGIREYIDNKQDVPVPEVLEAVAERLSFRRSDMLYGLMYAEDHRAIVINHREYTMSPAEHHEQDIHED